MEMFCQKVPFGVRQSLIYLQCKLYHGLLVGSVKRGGGHGWVKETAVCTAFKPAVSHHFFDNLSLTKIRFECKNKSLCFIPFLLYLEFIFTDFTFLWLVLSSFWCFLTYDSVSTVLVLVLINDILIMDTKLCVSMCLAGEWV